MLRPIGTLLLTMRLFLLVSRQFGNCRAILTVRVMIAGPPVVYLWRPDPRHSVQSRQLVPLLSFALFLVGLPHSVCCLQEEGHLEERRQQRISFFDIESDLSRDEVVPDLGAWRHNLRPRFAPLQAEANAYTRAYQRHSLLAWSEGSSFCPGTEGIGTLYFFFHHLDSCYMHVLMGSL